MKSVLDDDCLAELTIIASNAIHVFRACSEYNDSF